MAPQKFRAGAGLRIRAVDRVVSSLTIAGVFTSTGFDAHAAAAVISTPANPLHNDRRTKVGITASRVSWWDALICIRRA